jgi:AcrR family transcriptional regulator
MEGAERKRMIVKRAFDIIEEGGVAGLTTKRLAFEVGVSESALYRHFPSKDAILLAVVEEMRAIWERDWQRANEVGLSPSGVLRSFFEERAREFTELPSMSLILRPDSVFMRDEGLLSRIADMMRENRNKVASLLRQAAAAGELSGAMDAEVASLMLIGGFRLLVSVWRMEGLGGKKEALVSKTRAFMRSALTTL